MALCSAGDDRGFEALPAASDFPCRLTIFHSTSNCYDEFRPTKHGRPGHDASPCGL
jgi:hypothetical protein